MSQEQVRRKSNKICVSKQGYMLVRLDLTNVVVSLGYLELSRDILKQQHAAMKACQADLDRKNQIEIAKSENKKFIFEKQ